MPDPHRLSLELRKGTGPVLRRRRWIVGLSLLGAAMGQVVGLYQTGILRRLPDLPVDPFDATNVDAADYGYRRLQTPDGLLMVLTYAATAILAGAGGRDRAAARPWLPLAVTAKTLYDSVTALTLAREEWRETRALCGYCQTATLASLASVALSLPETALALGPLLHRGRHALRL
jgi:Vitamin K epoxide reductase family